MDDAGDLALAQIDPASIPRRGCPRSLLCPQVSLMCCWRSWLWTTTLVAHCVHA